jgi:hypothetical protein
MNVILFKVAVVVASTLLGAWWLRSQTGTALSDRSFLSRVLALQLLPALGLFVALYVAGKQEVTSDVPGYYLPVARAVLAGQVPYRDFSLSYAPIFPYVGAALISIWNSGKVFALFAILLNALSLMLWHGVATICTDRHTARTCTALYATSGHLVIQALLGTNQIWIATALAASCLLLVRGRSFGAGLMQAGAACVTKFLVLLFWPVLWICAPQRVRWSTGVIFLSAAVYGAFALTGADVLDPLRRQGDLISSGNLPYLLEPLLRAWGGSDFHLFDVLALGLLAGAVLWLYSRSRILQARQRPLLLFSALALVGVIFMFASKKSYTGYAVFFMYPAIIVLIRGVTTQRAVGSFLMIFNALLAAEPGLWFHFRGNGLALEKWLPQVDRIAAGTFLLIETALLACYLYLAYLSLLSVRRTVAGATVSSNVSQAPTACSLV